MNKFAVCAFSDKPGQRTYDYAVSFPVKPGDVIKVPAARGDGFQKVHVIAVKETTDVKPEWIKTAIGIYEPETEDNGEEK